MEGVDLPLLHALQLRPQTGAGQGVGEDLEEGEVLEAGVVPQLGEQAALLKQTQKRGLLRDKPPSLLSSQPAPSPGPDSLRRPGNHHLHWRPDAPAPRAPAA